MEFQANGEAGQYPPGTTTGRCIVLFEDGATEAGLASLAEVTDGLMATTSSEDVTEATVGEPDVYHHLGVAVVDVDPRRLHATGLVAAEGNGILAIEPERINQAIRAAEIEAAPAVHSAQFLLGYREAVLHLTAPATNGNGTGVAATVAAVDETRSTWGLQATHAVTSRFTGKGVRVAVLDTGFDLKHPDFRGRKVTTKSFVAGEAVQDGNGHGTHCIGTSMGPKSVPAGPRYGIAHEAEIYAGKVLSNAGSGSDSQILAGIEWAISNRCAVISMSLGATTSPGQGFSRVFEAVAARAQRAGTLIVAAAGNDSNRPGSTIPVSHPANCPSVMAVAALDSSTKVAFFSNRGINPSGGQVDIAGPGVDVYSTSPMPARYRRLSGTSMATPHVAGVAALLAQANPGARGAALWHLLTTRAQRLAISSADVGSGLVQAP